MNPIMFEEVNTQYSASGCGDLPSYKGQGQIIHCWKMTFFERLKALCTGKVWVGVQGSTQPPMFLSVDHPFEEVSGRVDQHE